MATAGSATMPVEVLQNGLEFLLDPVDRFPLTEVTADVERPDPMVLVDVLQSAPAANDSSCAVLIGQFGESSEQSKIHGKRPHSPTGTAESTGEVNPEAPGWTRRLRIGRAPPDRAPCAGRVTPLEETIRKYADKPTENVVKPEIGMSFDSLGEAYDFYNLYSWELGFGIRYGKSRLNVERTKCTQEIVCGCSSGAVTRTNIAIERHASKIYTRKMFEQFGENLFEGGGGGGGRGHTKLRRWKRKRNILQDTTTQKNERGGARWHMR
ncbi:uncharacterized protein [Aegilops tauschii subsp. strangulata]|uniref:uncharacterized protein isoform X1 n=1 Tax=Aegilops tauschii subsp. strangulata TaxID=200361 RepID=UPI003CC84F94